MEPRIPVQLLETDCPFCGPAPYRVRYPARLDAAALSAHAFSARRTRRRQHYRIVRCTMCGLLRSDPVLAEEDLARLYGESEFLYAEEARFAAATYADLVRSLLPSLGGIESVPRLVEVGCSTGFFLEEARRIGFRETLGFEPSRACVAAANATIRPAIVNDVYRPEKLAGREFDLLASFHVIDHLCDPLGFLTSASGALRPGGFVLLVAHDAGAPLARLLGSFNPIFDVEHICLFTRATVRTLLERAGLRVLEIGPLANTYPLGYWLRLAPGLAPLAAAIPAALGRLPVRLRAGNLYALGQKEA